MLLILLVVLGYLAARFAVDWLARHALVVSGAEYLVLGLLLGPRGTELLTPLQLEGLAPFFTLAIGWMGVSLGFQFWLPVLTRTPGILFRLAFVEALLTMGLVGGSAWLLLVPWVLRVHLEADRGEEIEVPVSVDVGQLGAVDQRAGQRHTGKLLYLYSRALSADASGAQDQEAVEATEREDELLFGSTRRAMDVLNRNPAPKA